MGVIRICDTPSEAFLQKTQESSRREVVEMVVEYKMGDR